MKSQIRKLIAAVTATVMLMTIALPAVVLAGTPADDLKQIEYKYYFRGKYQQAIEALQVYLARVDVTGTDARRGREFLAASYVLAGAADMAKDVFTRIIAADPAYAGPDPTVFKLEVMDVYAQARSERAALALKEAPPGTTTGARDGSDDSAGAVVETASKPIYRKWWFYAGLGAAALVAGIAAGGGDDGGSEPRETGSVIVGVTVH
jgi:hypothetical protein